MLKQSSSAFDPSDLSGPRGSLETLHLLNFLRRSDARRVWHIRDALTSCDAWQHVVDE